MSKLNHFAFATLLAASSLSFADDGFIRTRSAYNGGKHSIGSEIQTKSTEVYFAHDRDVYTAISVRPEGVSKLPDRAGLRDFVHAELADGRLAWASDSSNEIRPLVWPKGLVPPAKEQPEIFAALTGKVGIVWKSEKLKTVENLPTVIDAVTHFPESQRLAVLYTPRGTDFTTLEVRSLADSTKKQTFQLTDKASWSHVCWLDKDRLLLSFQGRVSCDYAVYNIATSTYEVPRQTRVMGSFGLRGDELWCTYSSKPEGDNDLEEKVWPKQ